MPIRVSAVPHEYAGRMLGVGHEFECEENDVAFMLALGRIRPVKGEAGYVEPRQDVQSYQTRDLVKRRKAAA